MCLTLFNYADAYNRDCGNGRNGRNHTNGSGMVWKVDTSFRLRLRSAQLNGSHQGHPTASLPDMPRFSKTCPLRFYSFLILCVGLWVVWIVSAPFLPVAWSQTDAEVDAEQDEDDFGLDKDEGDPADLQDALDEEGDGDDIEQDEDDATDAPFMEDEETSEEGADEPDDALDRSEEPPVGGFSGDSPLHFDPDDVATAAPSRAGSNETARDAMAVRLLKTEAAIARGDLDEAQALWRDVPGEEVAKFDIYNRLVPGYMKRGEFLKALEVLLLQQALVDHAPDDVEVLSDPNLKRTLENDIRLIVKTKLEEAGLQAVVKQYAPRFPTDLALLRLATLYDAQGDYERTGEVLRRFMADFPNHPDTADARTRANAVQDKIKVLRHRIGVVLPLRGAMAPFGQAVLDGIRLAIGQYNEAHPKSVIGWGVRDVDEAETPFSTWLTTYRPMALVGPLLSRDVNRIVPLISKTDLLLITPGATASEVVGLGTSVVRNAFSTRAQCRAIAGRAAGEMRLKRFAVLYPAHRSGPDWMKCFSEEVARQGGQVVVAESYPPGATDFATPIGRIAEKGLRTAEDGLAIDAIFLPADAAEAGLIVPQLAFHGIVGVALLGINSWNDPEFLKRAGRHAEEALFADGFFLESKQPSVRAFVAAYQKRFGRPPDLLAAQGYDATWWILKAIASGADTPKKVALAVTAMKRYEGASGDVSEIQNGEAIKRPFFIQVKKGRFVQVE